MVTKQVDRNLVVSITVTIGSVPSLNPNQILSREVMQTLDLRIFMISPDRWIDVVVIRR
jgi:hypothetical protein